MRFITALAAFSCFVVPASAASVCGLTKNSAGEYLIANYNDFLLMGQGGCTLTATDSYRLTASFSAKASATRVNDQGMGIGPLPGLYGKLRGGGFTISDLTIHQPTLNNVGLFSSIRETGLIDSLELANASVQGRVEVGVFAARNFGTLSAIRSTGTLTVECTAADPVYGGGLVAYNVGLIDQNNGFVPALIENSSSAVNVTAKGMYASAGGLVAFNTHRGLITGSLATGTISTLAYSDATGRSIAGGVVADNWGVIEKSYATGNISATNSSKYSYNHVGGLVGRSAPGGGTSEPFLADRGTIRQCWAAGQIASISTLDNLSTYNVSMDAGGLVGFSSGTIRNSYASGTVVLSGTRSPTYWYAGALVGNNYSGSLIDSSYALGQVTAKVDKDFETVVPTLGGLVGSNVGKVEKSYWPNTTLASACGGNTGTCTAIPLSVENLKKQSSFTSFDFTNIWSIVEDQTTPMLKALLRPIQLQPVSVSRTYDGTAYSGHGGIASIPALTNLGDYLKGTPTVTGNSQGAINAGTYEIKISDYYNTRQDGYTFTYLPGKLTIDPIELSLTGLTVKDKTYNGSTAATIVGTAQLDDAKVVIGDVVDLGECLAEGTFQNKNAGNNKTVVLSSCTLVGEDAANYTLASSLQASILPRYITVTADSMGKTVGASDPAFTYKLSAALEKGDALSGKLSRSNGESIGPYKILQGTLSGAPNYLIDFVGAPFVIIPAKTPTLIPLHKEFMEFRYAQGVLGFSNVHGPVTIFDAQARSVYSFLAHGNGEEHLSISAGFYWIHTLQGMSSLYIQ